MQVASLNTIFTTLNAEGTNYLVVGGVAVNAHGYHRFTKDLDLVVQLDEANLSKALTVLDNLGYKPVIPVSSKAFANPEIRKNWVEEKGMVVYQLFSEKHETVPIDIFVTEPFDFAKENAEAVIKSVEGGPDVPFVSIPTLIDLKKASNRPEDRVDIERLSEIKNLQNEANS